MLLVITIKFYTNFIMSNTYIFYKTFVLLFFSFFIFACSNDKSKTTDTDIALRSLEQSISIEEGETSEFVFELNKISTTDVNFDWSVQYNTTSTNDFIGAISGLKTISAGDTTTTIIIKTRDDSIYEGDESFVLQITSVTGATPRSLSTSGSILDNDSQPIISLDNDSQPIIFFEQADSTATEGTNFSYTLRLAHTSATNVIFDWSVQYGSTSVNDFTGALAGSKQIAAGSTTADITIYTIDDSVYEGNESFSIHITNIRGASNPISLLAGGSIIDNESQPGIAFEQMPSAITEGTSITYSLRLTHTSITDVIFDWFVRHSSTSTNDFTGALAGSKQIAAGSTTADITIYTSDDSVYERDESFSVNIIDIRGASSLINLSAGGSIINNDSQPTIAFELADIVAIEGTSITYSLQLNKASDLDVAFDWFVQYGSTSASDFTGALFGSKQIAAGSTTVDITIYTSDDSVYERDESFSVNIIDIRGASSLINLSAGGSIINNDSQPTIAFELAASDVIEGTSITYSLQLNKASDLDVSFVWFVRHSSTSANDFTGALLGSEQIAAGSTTVDITIYTIDDSVYERDESFSVNIIDIRGASSLINLSAGGSIINNDPQPSLTFELATSDVIEGTSITYSLQLNKASDLDVAFDWFVQYGSTSASDFTGALLGSKQIAAGSTTADITIYTSDDSVYELDESFSVNIIDIRGASSPISLSAGGSIINNDPQPSLTFELADIVAIEGTSITYSLQLNKASDLDVAFVWSVQYGSTSASDFTGALFGSKQIAAGSTTVDITIYTSDDILYEGNESFSIHITNIRGASSPINLSAGGSIIDNESQPGIAFEQMPSAITEGASITYSLRLTHTSTTDVIFDWFVRHSSTSTNDFTGAIAGSKQIAEGSTTADITIYTSDNTIYEGTESFSINITNIRGASSPISLSAGGSIIDNDPQPSLTFEPAASDVIEGTSITYSLQLNKASALDVVFDWSVQYGSTSANDFTGALAGSKQIAAGSTTADITIYTSDDSLYERDESFSIHITNTRGASSPIGLSASGRIIDNKSQPGIDFELTTHSVLEGTSITYRVRLTHTSTTDVIFDWFERNSSTSANDFTGTLFGSKRIAAGSTTADITIYTNDDSVYERDEIFSIHITNIRGASSPISLSASGRIIDNRSHPGIDFELATSSALEGASITYRVRLAHSSATDVIFDWFVRNSSTSVNDFTGALFGSKQIAAGSTTADITIYTNDDSVYERDESFSIHITNIRGASSPISLSAGGSIINNDPQPIISFVQVTDFAYTTAEGTSITYSLQLNKASDLDVVFDWSVQYGSTSANDFTGALAGSKQIAAGSTTADITIYTSDDSVYEGNESFSVNITNIRGASPISLSTGGSIIDNESQPGIAFELATRSALEGASITYRMRLTHTSATNIVFDWFVQYGSTSASDFTRSLFGSKQIAAGSTTADLTIYTSDDSVYERDESFSVNITNIRGASSPINLSAGGSIINNDPQPIISFLQIDDFAYTTEEGASFSYNLQLNKASALDVAFDWSVRHVSTSVNDFTGAVFGSKQIVAGDITATAIVLEINDDFIPEDDESFFLEITNIRRATTTSSSSRSSALFTIRKNDLPTSIDYNNNGLIDIFTKEQFYNIRNNLAGNTYKTTFQIPGTSHTIPGVPGRKCGGSDCHGYELLGNIFLTGNWQPIGSENDPFTSVLQGNDYSITNLAINRGSDDKVGLFARLSGATINNLTVEVVSISGNNDVGALAGSAENSTISEIRIRAVNTNSNLSARGARAGGLLGAMMSTTITNVITDLNIVGSADNVGGIVGDASSSTISYATNIGSVSASSGADNVGGLVGRMDNTSDINNSSASGSVSNTGDRGNNGNNYGGLVGLVQNNSTISNSSAVGSVSSVGNNADNYGGLVGLVQNNSTISESNAAVAVAGNGDRSISYGGLVGRMDNTSDMNNSFAIGSVSGSGRYSNYYGGLIGRMGNNSTISNSGASGAVAGNGYRSNSYGGLVGRMYSNSRISNSSASGSVTSSGTDSWAYGGLVGRMNDNSNVDYGFASGIVTSSGIDNNSYGGLVGYLSDSSVKHSFASGNVISSGTYSNSYGGLVGLAQNSSTIFYSSASGNVAGNRDHNDYYGGLIGSMNYNSNVKYGFASGIVTSSGNSSHYYGGLVGRIKDSGSSVNTSSASGNVYSSADGNYNYGGLVGENAGDIHHSWASGSVFGNRSADNISGNVYRSADGRYHYGGGENGGNPVAQLNPFSSVFSNRAAGLVGYNLGTVGSSYALGFAPWGLSAVNFGTIENSFWNSETSGAPLAAGIVGAHATNSNTASMLYSVGGSTPCSDRWYHRWGKNGKLIQKNGVLVRFYPPCPWKLFAAATDEFEGNKIWTFESGNYPVIKELGVSSGLAREPIFRVTGVYGEKQRVKIVDQIPYLVLLLLQVDDKQHVFQGREILVGTGEFEKVGEITEIIGYKPAVVGAGKQAVRLAYGLVRLASPVPSSGIDGFLGATLNNENIELIANNYNANDTLAILDVNLLQSGSGGPTCADGSGDIIMTTTGANGTRIALRKIAGSVEVEKRPGNSCDIIFSNQKTDGTLHLAVTVTKENVISNHEEEIAVTVNLHKQFKITLQKIAPTISLQSTTLSTSEGDKLSLALELNYRATTDVSFNWSVQHNTTSASDFTGAISGFKTMPFGDTTATIELEINDDTLLEPAENFTLNITNITGATPDSLEASITILGSDVDNNGNRLIDITTQEQLSNIRYNLAGTSYKTSSSDAEVKCGYNTCRGYELLANIALSANWQPIGSEINPFASVLRGNGYSITNLVIDGGDHLGLFAALFGCKIDNLVIEVVSISGDSYVGALAGYAVYCAISNVEIRAANASSKLQANLSVVGGLLGYINGSSIINVTSNLSVVGGQTTYLGGIVGYAVKSVIEYVTSSGSVSTSGNSNNVGGFAGYLNSSTISYSSASGNVISSGINSDYYGGLVGHVYRSTIIYSSASGNVYSSGSSASGGVYSGSDGNYNYGGLVGGSDGDIKRSGDIRHSWSSGSVFANNSAGLVGNNQGNFEFSYALGVASYGLVHTNIDFEFSYTLGVAPYGSVHTDIDPINNTYWNSETSGALEAADVTDNTINVASSDTAGMLASTGSAGASVFADFADATDELNRKIWTFTSDSYPVITALGIDEQAVAIAYGLLRLDDSYVSDNTLNSFLGGTLNNEDIELAANSYNANDTLAILDVNLLQSNSVTCAAGIGDTILTTTGANGTTIALQKIAGSIEIEKKAGNSCDIIFSNQKTDGTLQLAAIISKGAASLTKKFEITLHAIQPILSLQPPTLDAREGDNLVFNLELNHRIRRALSFDWSVQHISTSTSDFRGAIFGSKTIPVGYDAATIAFEINNDNRPEPAEDFTLNITNIRGITHNNLSASITILENYLMDDNDNGFIDIVTEEDLHNIRYNLAGTSYKTSASGVGETCGGNACRGYELSGDLDLSEFANWQPIGSEYDPFTSILQGNGYSIANLVIDRGNNIGLFAALSGATIDNLVVEVVSIIGNSDVGALAGRAENSAISRVQIRAASASSKLSARGERVGGMLGAMIQGTTITNVTSDLDVVGIGGAGLVGLGGIVGYVEDSNISYAYSSASVSAGNLIYSVGGLAGYMINSSVSYSSASGSVSGSGTNVNYGGLVGYMENSSVSYSSASGSIISSGQDVQNHGGLVGYMTNSNVSYSSASGNVIDIESLFSWFYGGLVGYATNSGKIIHSWSSGSVGATGFVAGLIGYNNIDVKFSYVLGTILPSGFGLAETNAGTITNGYWNSETSGALTASQSKGTVTNIASSNTAGMLASTGFAGASVFADFADATDELSDNIWTFTSGNYPVITELGVDKQAVALAYGLLRLASPNVGASNLDSFLGATLNHEAIALDADNYNANDTLAILDVNLLQSNSVTCAAGIGDTIMTTTGANGASIELKKIAGSIEIEKSPSNSCDIIFSNQKTDGTLQLAAIISKGAASLTKKFEITLNVIQPIISLQPTTLDTREGDTLVFTLELSRGISRDVTFDWSVQHNTTSASDLTGAIFGFETIPFRDTTATIELRINDDNLLESVENFTLNITNITGAIPDRLEASITILGSDADNNGNGLIDILTQEHFDNIRYNLAGTSYRASHYYTGANCGGNACRGYELLGDLDLSEFANWQPIGSENDPFTSILQGNGYSIANLVIDGGNNIGLFATLSGATIDNLVVEVASISGDNYVGALAGSAANSTISRVQIRAASASSKLSARGEKVGGMLGAITDTTITNVTSDLNVVGSNYNVGGIAGYVLRSDISYATSSGSVTSSGSYNFYYGGLAGLVEYNSRISHSSASGSVTSSGSTNSIYGGLVGLVRHNSEISNSSASGSVTSSGSYNFYYGGLVGWVKHNSEISDSSASGSVTSSGRTNLYYGGLVGSVWNDSAISYSSASGSVASNGDQNYYHGGLVGHMWSDSRISNSSASGSVTSSGDANVYYGGFVGAVGSDSAISYSSASGSVTSRGDNNDHHGGFAGAVGSDSAISYSSASGSVTSRGDNNDHHGGFAGYLNSSTISYSSASGSVTSSGEGNNNYGGLVGLSAGEIMHSWSSSSVFESAAAGLVGNNTGSLGFSYALGNASYGLVNTNTGTITNSYWNSETSGVLAAAKTMGVNTNTASSDTVGMLGIASYTGSAGASVFASFAYAIDESSDKIWTFASNSYPVITELGLDKQAVALAYGLLRLASPNVGASNLDSFLGATLNNENIELIANSYNANDTLAILDVNLLQSTSTTCVTGSEYSIMTTIGANQAVVTLSVTSATNNLHERIVYTGCNIGFDGAASISAGDRLQLVATITKGLASLTKKFIINFR